MKRLLISLILLCLMPLGEARAGGDTCRMWIGLGGGAGYGVFRDGGAGPVTFQGVEVRPSVSFHSERGVWRWEAAVALGTGGYMRRLQVAEPEAYGLMPEVRMGAMRELLRRGRWRVLAGASLTEAFDFRYIPSMGNNSTGTSNFVLPVLSGRGETTLGPWRLHAQVGFAPMGIVLRPGYAYIANYDHTMQNPVEDHFGEHHTYVATFNALETEVGATVALGNGNRIGTAYRWGWLTSGSTERSPHRFDRAGHALQVTLMFAL